MTTENKETKTDYDTSTYQADLFDNEGDCYFDGWHIGTCQESEYAYDL